MKTTPASVAAAFIGSNAFSVARAVVGAGDRFTRFAREASKAGAGLARRPARRFDTKAIIVAVAADSLLFVGLSTRVVVGVDI